MYEKHFGFDMPDDIRCTVECGPDKGSRLYTDGEDRVFLSMPSADKLLRPGSRATFTLYGLCHELGHVAMYRIVKDRAWMTTAAAEGWAHYAGSVVVDEVYKAHGEKLWAHDPYDYRADGTARLDKQLKDKRRRRSRKARASGRSWVRSCGPKGISARTFESLQTRALPARRPQPVASALAEAFARARMPNKANEIKPGGPAPTPVLFEATEASTFKKAGIDKSKLERRPVKLELDDNTARRQEVDRRRRPRPATSTPPAGASGT